MIVWNDDPVSALWAIPADTTRDEWVRDLMAAHAAGVSQEEAEQWSAQAPSFNERDFRDVWRSIKPGGGIGAGTLYAKARQHGFNSRPHSPRKTAAAPTPAPKQAEAVSDLLARFHRATADQPYIVAKEGIPDGLYVVPEGDPFRQMGERWDGALVVPVYRADGTATSAQLIAPPALAERLKAAGKPTKQNLKGHPIEGWFTVGDWSEGTTSYLCEGYGQAVACWKATGRPAVVCFGWGRVRSVAMELKARYPSASLVLVPDTGMEDEAEKIAAEVGAEYVRMPEGWPKNSDVNDLGQREGFDAVEHLLASPITPVQGSQADTAQAPPFTRVPFADIFRSEVPAPSYAWEGLMPLGFVTHFAAHGGTGKSLIALMLAVSVVLGRPLFNIPTRQGKAVFFSGEDGASLLRYRLRMVCACMNIDVQDLEDRLFILDATTDPTLFAEVTTAGRKEGTPTATYHQLRDFLAGIDDVRLIVVDNASDAYDASEIDRARVRGFMRALAHIARDHDAAVVLLAHIDKGTSRGERTGTEGYSGSTAWNNSARSRIFMSRDKEGGLLIEHQKHNLGKLHEPLRLEWPEGGLPQAEVQFGPVVQGIADRGHERAILRLIAEFSDRGEHITTATTSRSHAAKVLQQEPTFPKLKDAEVFDILRKAERAGRIVRLTYKGPDRHQRERWEVTPSGREYAGLAATAGTAATNQVTAPAQCPQEPAATAATSPLGGMGETAPHMECPQ